MSKYSSKDCLLLIDGYNVLGVTTQLNHSIEAMIEEITALGDTWASHKYLDMKKSTLSQEGFFDDASASSNDALNEQQGNERVLVLGFAGNTIGKKFVGFEGQLETKFDRIASRGKLHRANAEYLGSGVVEEGVILHALTARTADGNTESSSVNNSAQSTGGADLYLQITDLDLGGYDDVTIVVRQSVDNAAWEDLDTFTAVTAAQTAERRIKAGTIKQYLAVSWTFGGVGSDPSVTFLVGAVRT